MFHGWLPGYSPLPRVAGQVSKKTRGDGLALSTALLPQDGLTATLNIPVCLPRRSEGTAGNGIFGSGGA